MQAETSGSKFRMVRRLPVLALVAALGSVPAPSPMAVIIDSGPISYAVPQTAAGLYINLVTGAHGTAAQAPGWDFNPFTSSGNLAFFASSSAANLAHVVATAINSGIAMALPVGSTVGGASLYQTAGTAQTTGTAFRTTGVEFVGISFNNEAFAGTNYGYAQIQTTAGTGFPATVLRYVYENTGVPITVAAPPPTILYAYNRGNNHLVSFNAATPGTLLSDVPLSGLAPTEFLAGIDFRPANSLLYGTITNAGVQRLVRIDTATGLVQPVSSTNNFPAPAGLAFGLDFNPTTADRVREVSDAEASIRINPNNGTLAGTDTALAYAAGDPNFGVNPHVVHVAYANNQFGVATATLYGIDAATDSLVRIGGVDGTPSPNTGQLFTIGPLGVSINDIGGFDIHFAANIAYAALQPPIGGASSLYTIDLATGAATLIGTIGAGMNVGGLSVAFSNTPVLLSVVSRKVHGGATFDLLLSNLVANPTTEPRAGPTHTLVFTFNVPIGGSHTLLVNEGIATLGAGTNSGDELIVPLTGVTDAQYVTVGVTKVSDISGNCCGGGTVRIGFLAGDVNQSRVVSLSDVGLVNAQLAQPVSPANYLKDVNASGTLTLTDKALTNAALTHSLPPP